ncbi:MAG: M24 family metallopeptidase [Thermodesulfobacteriota bacterium]
MKKGTYLIIDTSEENADLYYKTGFFVPDPVIYLEHNGKKILVLSDLEIERGREEASVDRIVSLTDYQKRLVSQKVKRIRLLDVVDLVLKDLKIKKVFVPGKFALKYADGLRKRGYTVTSIDEEPFFEERLRKTPREIGMIADSLKTTVKAMDMAIKMIASSEIRKSRLYLNGGLLTSERVKGEINAELSRMGFTASHTIVASGAQSSMPHHSGEGPIYAHKPVVIDIFPRSQKNGYFGDMTRTVVRGEPLPELVKMYDTVLRGQKLAIGMIKAGVEVRDIHFAVVEYFNSRGFETAMIEGKMQGFIHSTGHGLGLEIHEPPRIGLGDEVLETDNVVTVEPGLYYEKIGGVRIEDVVVVEKKGCANLTKYPKRLIAK